MKYSLKKISLGLLLTAIFFSCLSPLSVSAAERLQEVSERPVIVIDPGHGGENLGTQGGWLEEKYMTMITAKAMYEELCRYDNVDVYLTRTEDVDMSLKARAEFAESVNADFMFSLHYNASEYKTKFGTEIWIPLEAPYNGYGYQFGMEYLAPLTERGLFNRGIKTRIGEEGLNYYGIIREAVKLEIPTVILEHCHVDEERDSVFCDSEEKLKQFGIDDATAVAKYFGLKSSKLNVDYSDYQLAEASDTGQMPKTRQDDTPPDVCLLEFADADYGTGSLTLTVSAADYDTPLLYYDYSIDGGETYSPLNIWPGCDALTGSYDDVFSLKLQIPDGVTPSVILRAYNLYNLTTDSNCYRSTQAFILGQGTSEAAVESETMSNVTESESLAVENGAVEGKTELAEGSLPAVSENTETAGEIDILTFLQICLAVVIVLFVLLLISQFAAYRRKKQRRRQRRNVSEENRNQNR